MSEKLEAREFRNPAGRWYLTLATANEANPAEQFLSEDQAKGIADTLNRPIPMAASVEGSNRPRVEDTIARRMKVIPWPGTPLATPEELRLAHAIVDSDPVLRVFAAVEWDCLDENGKKWIAIIIREAARQAQLVPGVLTCAKCDFRLTKTTLCVTDGNAYANNDPDNCPNCKVPMWRVTWREEAAEAYKVAESQIARAVAAEEKARRWDEWHDRASADDDCEYLNGSAWADAEAIRAGGQAND